MRPVTIALTRYAESDELLREVVAAACAQVGVAGEVLLIEQQADSGIRTEDYPRAKLPLRVVHARVGGLSEARNLALDQATHELVLFLDADAVAAPDWAAKLAEALDEEDVGVAGSRIIPRWSGREPLIATARVVRDQYSLFELGTGRFPYPRAVGAGFGIDTKKTGSLRFDPSLGRRDGRLFSGEESEYCHRVALAGLKIVYEGGAIVEHVIAPERMRLGWVAKRLLYAGRSRATVGGAPSPSRPPGLADWLTLPVTLPPYALGWLWGKLAGRFSA